MAEPPAHVFRMSDSGACEALSALPPTPEVDRLCLRDWCAKLGHLVLDSLPLFPLARDVALSPDQQVDFLLLTDAGVLVAVLIDSDPPPSLAPVVGSAVAACHWCSTLKYHDLEELYNSDQSEPVSLHEAYRQHFGQSPAIPSDLGRTFVVLLVLPQGHGPNVPPLTDFLCGRALPVLCLKYACFRAAEREGDTLLLLSRSGEVPLAARPRSFAPAVNATVFGDLAAAVTTPEPSAEDAGASALPLASLARRQPGGTQT